MRKSYQKKILQSEEPFAICMVSVAPIYAKPYHEKEQVNQLLFGELAEIIDQKGKHWYKIQCEWDGYIGWVDSKQIHKIDSRVYRKFKTKQAYTLELVHAAMGPNESIPLCIGSTLPLFDGINFKTPLYKMAYTGQAIFSNTFGMDSYKLIKLGLKYMHAPYQWGGRSAFGIDGSGLIQMVFKLAGIRVPRDAEEQLVLGEVVDFPENVQPSDLAFFEDSKGNICHVGMVVEKNRIIHAFGKVRMDFFDHHGIFNEDLAKYTHKLRIIKRIEIPTTSSLSSGSVANSIEN